MPSYPSRRGRFRRLDLGQTAIPPPLLRVLKQAENPPTCGALREIQDEHAEMDYRGGRPRDRRADRRRRPRVGADQDRRGALGHRPGLIPRRPREEDAGDVRRGHQRRRAASTARSSSSSSTTTAATPTTRAPSPPAWSSRTRSSPWSAARPPARRLAMIPLFEEAQIPFISLAGAIQIIEPVRKWVFKTPHTDKMACEKIFADLKRAQSDDDRVDLRHRCVRQVDARPMRGGRAEGRHHDRARGDLRPARQRHDPAAHQHPQQGGRAGGDQSGLRSGPGDRDAQLPPARRSRCRSIRATAWPRSSSSTSPAPAAEGVRLPAAALLVADKLADSDPQKPVVVNYSRTYQQKTGQTGLHLRRPRL